ncbi:MAG: DMT family transporter [Oscillospiraceae bacterium]|nr:DMT family transporter [Oscillospiraceae bacterium]
MKQNVVRHVIFPLLAALIWGTAFVAQSICARYLPPFAVNALRSAIAVAVLTPLSLGFDALRARNGERAKTDWKRLALGSLVCGLFLAAGTNLQQAGLADTSAGKAGFITAFYVVLVPVFGIFLKKPSNLRIWISIVLVALGLYLLCIPAGERFALERGDTFLILCAVFYALQVLSVDRHAQRVDGLKLSIGQFLVAGTISALLSVCFERGAWSLPGLRRCVLPLLYIGVMSSGVGYTLQILSQKGGNPTLVSVLFSLESVFSVLAGAVVLGDRLSGREYLGCAVMFCAVILAQLPGGKGTENGSTGGFYEA